MADIEACRKQSATEEDFTKCAARAVFKKYKTQVDCFTSLTDGEKVACFSNPAQNAAFTSLIGCLGGGKPTLNKVSACTTDPAVDKKISQVRSCIASADSEDAARKCVAATMSSQQREVAQCLGNAGTAQETAACLDSLSPEMKKARQVADCVTQSSDREAVTQCILGKAGGDAGKIARCIKGPNVSGATACILGNSPQAQAASDVYRCIEGGRDAAALIAGCTQRVLDDKSRQTLSCISRAQDDRAQLAGCAASAVLPPEAARIVGCASNSAGPTSFALCAAGPQMNEEWRIAAECAVQSGGNPVSFTGCTAGRLTVRELTKCFSGQVGKDCFGPNNSIVVTLKNSFNDITHGPGENNEIVKAIRTVGEITGGPNSVINNPDQIFGGPDSVFNNPKQILGGDHSVFNDPGQVLDPGRWRF
jgi:hypothetical protein